MQEYYIVRQPVPFGGMGGGMFPLGTGQGFTPMQGPGQDQGQGFTPMQGSGFFPPGQGPGFFPQGQSPGFSPGQGPGFPPGQGPGFPPPGGGAGMGPPAGRPPAFVPPLSSAQQTQGAFAINPGAIRRCMFRYSYIWLNNGQQFWAWLVFVGRDSAAGWRWTGFNWIYFGIDLNRISSFVCY
jgi:hypothetical protein